MNAMNASKPAASPGAPPRLYCGGVELDTSPAKLGELQDSRDIAGDIAACKARMNEEGYLFFRGLIDRDVVLEARREIMLKYAIVGEIDSINHPVIEGIQQENTFIDKVNLFAFNESIRTGLAYNNVIMNERLVSFYERFLGGKITTFDFKWPRFVRPGEGCGLHCDVVYVGRGTRNLWSSWIPIGDVTREEGALIILERSHTSKLLEEYWTKDADRDKIGWLSNDPPALQAKVGGRWLTTDFRAGDVLCFSIYLAHAALDNRSPIGRCRLTSDSRYQLAREPLDDRWNGDISNPHGGAPKAFLPGLGKWNNNKEFEEEWKPVDRYGRLLTQQGGTR
jgi:ectoine hydroxylase-related dioxygenase (phytanoyl-CoA dioxygenase family)